jgi:hypothetical protein
MADAANVGTAERIGSSIAGAALIARAFARPSLARFVVAIGGWMLLQRGMTGHCSLYQALGIGDPSREPDRAPGRDRVTEASEDSFPASDPPAWTPVAGTLAAR